MRNVCSEDVTWLSVCHCFSSVFITAALSNRATLLKPSRLSDTYMIRSVHPLCYITHYTISRGGLKPVQEVLSYQLLTNCWYMQEVYCKTTALISPPRSELCCSRAWSTPFNLPSGHWYAKCILPAIRSSWASAGTAMSWRVCLSAHMQASCTIYFQLSNANNMQSQNKLRRNKWALLTSEVFTWACLRGLPRPLFSAASFSFGETVPFLSLMFA